MICVLPGRLPSRSLIGETRPGLEGGDALALYADALFGKGEHKRARSYYRRAIERRRGSGQWQGDGDGARARDEAEARLRLREAECGVVLDEHAAAIGSIEAVPVELRPAKARALLGKLYLQSGLKRNAITAFERARDKDPLCLEVIEPLQRLKASQQDFDEDDAMDSTNEKYPWYDVGVLRCCGGFTSSKRLVAIARDRGWFTF